jgi:hypothetical protein
MADQTLVAILLGTALVAGAMLFLSSSWCGTGGMAKLVDTAPHEQAAAGTALFLTVAGGRFEFGSMAHWFRTWDLAALTPSQIRTVAEHMQAAHVPQHILQAIKDTGESMRYDNAAILAHAVEQQRRR